LTKQSVSEQRTVVVPVDAPAGEQWRATVADLKSTWTERSVWMFSAAVAVGNRYRRTVLGPWWLTLTTLMFVFGIALLRVGLRGGDLREAIPYVGLGFIIFQLISGGITSGANTFVSAGRQLETSRRPYSTYVARTNATVFIDFLHDVVVILILTLIFAIPFALIWGWSVVAVVLIVISSMGVGLWLGPLVARFRDIGPMVTAFMRLMFFLTPIFWSIDEVEATGRSWLAWFNPLTYQMLAFRDPILGTTHPSAPIAPMTMALILAVVNVSIGVLVFWRTRPKIPYWVSQ
jgi:ABC-type polysaccharide/polyol phosphate export permease